jgi:hypothetical protein
MVKGKQTPFLYAEGGSEASCHTSKTVSAFLKETNNIMLNWAGHSPNMLPQRELELKMVPDSPPSRED